MLVSSCLVLQYPDHAQAWGANNAGLELLGHRAQQPRRAQTLLLPRLMPGGRGKDRTTSVRCSCGASEIRSHRSAPLKPLHVVLMSCPHVCPCMSMLPSVPNDYLAIWVQTVNVGTEPHAEESRRKSGHHVSGQFSLLFGRSPILAEVRIDIVKSCYESGCESSQQQVPRDVPPE